MSKLGSHIISTEQRAFVDLVKEKLAKHIKFTRPTIEKLAKGFGIEDKTQVKELTELAIVERGRELGHGSEDTFEKYQKIVALYNIQTNLSFRTSMSVLLQQYSTPAPIGYLMGLYCGIEDKDKIGFEPSAGNGLLTVAGKASQFIVNEIDPVRRRNLKSQGFKETLSLDASADFHNYTRRFDAVITNPPFGRLDKTVLHDGFSIKELDHHMAIIALSTMKTDGKAAIIIGGHSKYDELGRIQNKTQRIFFNYLYKHYNVEDVIPILGSKLYSRQGTSFNTRLILINGVNRSKKGVAPLSSKLLSSTVSTFDELYNRINMYLPKKELSALELEAIELESELLARELGAPYNPASDACIVLDTHVPDSMEFEMHSSIDRIKKDVGGDIDNFVRHRLSYQTKAELCRSLSAEQIDAVAMAIYNIEALGQAVIIGDQTGIGKGRVAASIIRYAAMQGAKAIFLTEKANLFSDIYRDLAAIGSAHLVPFIINGRESKTHIKDENGNIIYEALSKPEQDQIFRDKSMPLGYDFIVGTYSQFNSPEKKPLKPSFLHSIAKDAILIMDESHNSSGTSNTGQFMQGVLAKTKGAVFLSATFAKRPDNMPIYAMKTAISEANMTREELVEAIQKGGVALQEVLASQLVAEGQMIRRERSYEGIEVNYITLDHLSQTHKAIADNITGIVRDIIAFQTNFIDKRVSELDKIAAAEGKEVTLREGTSQAGVDNQPYFSKVFNVINQMLFALKAEAVADRAIMRLQQGKKPIIAFASTMGSFIEQMVSESGLSVDDGDTIKADFSIVLEKGLEGVMRYTVTEADGSKSFAYFDITQLSPEAQYEYDRILSNINRIVSGISISPIDVITQKLEKAGFSVAEVTGRKQKLQLNDKFNQGLIVPRKKINTNDAFRQFNNNEVDVLLINQSGSTGASAHAIPTDKVSESEVKQRVMIVLQPELDINTEVQKRGRINRTGQILKPIYDYVNSAIPAEQRLMMMLQKKLKSLDANTSSNQKQSNSILDVPDFLNKYGDICVMEYLRENEEVNELLGNPLKLGTSSEAKEGAAHKVSGRVAVLSTQMQEEFYQDIKDRYDTLVEYLKQSGDYDLEVEQLDLKAETISSSIIKVGKGGISSFGENSILEKVSANVLRKPFSAEEMKNLVLQSLEGKTPEEIRDELIDKHERYAAERIQKSINAISDRYARLIDEIPNEKKVLTLLSQNPEEARVLIQKRTKELNEAKAKRIEDEQNSITNKKQYINGLFKYFLVGKNLLYPVASFNGMIQEQLGVFLGFQIDLKRSNPFAPSAIKLKFAIASSQKYLAIPASFVKDISAIKGASYSAPKMNLDSLVTKWKETVQEDSVDRATRYIITGNILQAFADFKGKLVSYTTSNNEIKKGILMPEHWSYESETKGKIIIPIAKAFKHISSITVGSAIYGSSNLALFRISEDQFRVSVPASKKKGGDIFLDPALLELVVKGIFEKIGDQMVAILVADKLSKFLEILQDKHGITVSLSEAQFDPTTIKTVSKKRITLDPPPPEKEVSFDNRLLEIEAEALELELELLSF